MLILASLEKGRRSAPIRTPALAATHQDQQHAHAVRHTIPANGRTSRDQRANDFAGIRLPVRLEPKGFEVPTTAMSLGYAIGTIGLLT